MTKEFFEKLCEDKEYGGIAYYGIFYHEETLNE